MGLVVQLFFFWTYGLIFLFFFVAEYAALLFCSVLVMKKNYNKILLKILIRNVMKELYDSNGTIEWQETYNVEENIIAHLCIKFELIREDSMMQN